MGASSITTIDTLQDASLAIDEGMRLCIQRAASDDVTETFLNWAAQLHERGAHPLVVCADDVAYRRYQARLAAMPMLPDDCVATMQDVCLGIIANPTVSKVLGRDAYVLNQNEYDVLMEDVKVSGLKPRRLREMLKFFNKSLSEYANEEEGWLISQEEQTVFAILEENLEVRRALLPSEVAGQAYRGMQKAAVEPVPCTILVDDFATLSRASQRLLHFLATEGMVIAGNTHEAYNAQEAYPYPQGFADVMADESFERVALAQHATAPQVRQVTLKDPLEEFAYIADEVSACIDEGVAPCDILVAVPNVTWGRQVLKALEARGVAAAFDTGTSKIKGDPRTKGRYDALKLAAFLRLVEDPSNMTALRSWLGLGDWLLRSEAFLELMAYARDHACSVQCAIADLRSMKDSERTSRIFGKFDAPLDELDEVRAALREASPAQAAEVFSQHGMPLSASQKALLGAGERADVLALARGAFVPEPFPEQVVCIAPYARCHGRFVRATFIAGMVNGFLPAADAVDDKHTIDHKARALVRDRARFDDMQATARDQVVCTSFEQDRLENTATLPMQPRRVFVQDGERYAAIAPSEFVVA